MKSLILVTNDNDSQLDIFKKNLEINKCEIKTFGNFLKKDLPIDLKNIIFYLKNINMNKEDKDNLKNFIKNNSNIFSDSYNIFVISEDKDTLDACHNHISQINTSKRIKYNSNISIVKDYVCGLSKEMIEKSFKACYNVYEKKNDFLIEEYDDFIILAISGTDDGGDIFKNMKTLFKNRSGIHRGFLEYLNMVMVEMFFERSGQVELFKKNKKIILTGHSLGGAAVTILAHKLLKYNINLDISVITVGAPKVGNQNFVNFLAGSDILRFYFKDDIVTKVPFTYVHVNKGIAISDGNSFPNLFSNHKIKEYKNINSKILKEYSIFK
ncbi:Lipase (class 3) [seawater metagenome]|uniref:Lipase (Class 3) n=1 Tax=seawater metagenome TaxID=1561972 RepID=A0A5E8CL32_9ZZZZ